MWESNTTVVRRSQHQLFIELGGNIGAWSIEMLMRTGASLVVFELNPANLFRLTSTLHQLELERPRLRIAERVVVFPIGVGNESLSAQLFVARRNHGDSIVGTAVPQQGTMRVRHTAQQTGLVRQLDAIFPTRLPAASFRLMKLDVQGFECRALDGMRRLLQQHAVQAIVTELSVPHLEAQGCSANGMHDRLDELFGGQMARPRQLGAYSWTYEASVVSSWAQRLRKRVAFYRIEIPLEH